MPEFIPGEASASEPARGVQLDPSLPVEAQLPGVTGLAGASAVYSQAAEEYVHKCRQVEQCADRISTVEEDLKNSKLLLHQLLQEKDEATTSLKEAAAKLGCTVKTTLGSDSESDGEDLSNKESKEKFKSDILKGFVASINHTFQAAGPDGASSQQLLSQTQDFILQVAKLHKTGVVNDVTAVPGLAGPEGSSGSGDVPMQASPLAGKRQADEEAPREAGSGQALPKQPCQEEGRSYLDLVGRDNQVQDDMDQEGDEESDDEDDADGRAFDEKLALEEREAAYFVAQAEAQRAQQAQTQASSHPEADTGAGKAY